MSRKIRVLVIAPYEGMKHIVYKVGKEFEDIELTVFVGDLNEGVRIAKQNYYGNYDVIISRGGTAKLIEQKILLPVIEIEITTNDILRSLNLFSNIGKKCAVVGYPNVVKSSKVICDIAKLKIKNVEINSPEEAEHVINEMSLQGYDAILCDVISSEIAWKYGMNAYLINSGEESLRTAFKQARLINKNIVQVKDENIFLRKLLNEQKEEVIVYDQTGTLYYSSVEIVNDELNKLLLEELMYTPKEGIRRFQKSFGGSTYMIRAKKIFGDKKELFSFYVTILKTPWELKKIGISSYTKETAKKNFYSNPFSLIHSNNEINKILVTVEDTMQPIMICGEYGTGKFPIAQYIYFNSFLKENPLIVIDCRKLQDSSIDFLKNHHLGPFYSDNLTIIFRNVDSLSLEKFRGIISYMHELKVHKKNRIIFNSTINNFKNEKSISIQKEILESFHCNVVSLDPVRENKEKIPEIIKLIIGFEDKNLVNKIFEIEDEAMQLLQEYYWPHNYSQIHRVVIEISKKCRGEAVTKEIIDEILNNEKLVMPIDYQGINFELNVNLNGTLDEINQQIIKIILSENDGNKSLVAKKLGISRTTLWRMLKDG